LLPLNSKIQDLFFYVRIPVKFFFFQLIDTLKQGGFHIKKNTLDKSTRVLDAFTRCASEKPRKSFPIFFLCARAVSVFSLNGILCRSQ
jgi:hypothetical protein